MTGPSIEPTVLPNRPDRSRRATRLRTDAPVSVVTAVVWFVLTGAAALVIVSIGVYLVARGTASKEAVRDALRLTETLGRGVIEPALTDGIVHGDPDAIGALDRVVRSVVLGESVVRVKLWTSSGVIVYSDERRLIGSQFPFAPEEAGVFALSQAAAEVTDLSHPENEYEREWQKLLEVYFPVRTPDGTPLLFESYLPYESVSKSGNAILRPFLWPLISGLAALSLAQLPIAAYLARRLRRGHREREGLLRRVVEASERERRIVAGEIHDGAVQDLVGQSYQLSAAADQLSGTSASAVAQVLRDASQQSRRTAQELRSMLVDLYPPNLRSEGIGAALEDLGATLRSRGLSVAIHIDDGPPPAEHTERFLYRAAREAVRNVVHHAQASRVEIQIARLPGKIRLTVSDDGRGVDAAQRSERRATGHLGLDLIEETARDIGGRVQLHTDANGLTWFTAEVPTG